MRSNLSDMLLAIEGTIVMSTALRATLDAMYDARVPDTWEKISWQSATIGFWFTELLERDGQFRRWCFHGRPKVFDFFLKNESLFKVSIFKGVLGDRVLQSSRVLDGHEAGGHQESQRLGIGQCHLPELGHAICQRRHPRFASRRSLHSR